jgi:cell pole-organizing protein PopZ
MEEILASIRKIISEDSPDGQPAQPQAAAADEPEVLELTQEVEEEPAPAPVTLAPASAPVPQPVVAKPVDDVIFQTIKDPEPAPAPSGIFSASALKAFDDASPRFDRQEPAPAAPRDTRAPVAQHDGPTLEAIFDRAVRETFEPVLQKWMEENSAAIVERMKPAIAEWMDKNFPPLLSAAVEAEFVRTRRQR